MAATAPSSTAAAPGSASAGAASGTQGGQGVVLCPRTLSQVRRSRLRRALTEATAETVNYVKTVGADDFSLSMPYYAPHTGCSRPRHAFPLATFNATDKSEHFPHISPLFQIYALISKNVSTLFLLVYLRS